MNVYGGGINHHKMKGRKGKGSHNENTKVGMKISKADFPSFSLYFT